MTCNLHSLVSGAMYNSMKKNVRITRGIIGWLIVLCGAGVIGMIVPDIYFVVFDAGKPGTIIYSDHLAMGKSQIAKYLIFGIIILIVGYIITPERKYEYKEDTGRTASNDEPDQEEAVQTPHRQ